MNELLMSHPIVVYIIFAVFSLCIGSLLNVIIYRLPMMIQSEWTTQCRTLLHLPSVKDTPINLFLPRSHCPHCKHIIHAWNNIPILSFFLLKRKCAHCEHPISWQYPLIEFVCMSISLYALFYFGFNLTLLFSLLFIWCMICLTVIDLKHQILPDGLVLSLLWLGLIANTLHLYISLPTAVLSAAGAYIGLWIFAKLFQLITGKIGMGHGDLKLFAAFGAWFGWVSLPLILLISSIIGTIVSAIYLIITKQSKNTPIPFGPFLCLAGLTTLFYMPFTPV